MKPTLSASVSSFSHYLDYSHFSILVVLTTYYRKFQVQDLNFFFHCSLLKKNLLYQLENFYRFFFSEHQSPKVKPHNYL